MPSKAVPYDEWIELIGEDLEDDYTIVNDGDEDIYIFPGTRPSQATAGLPVPAGAYFSAEIDRGDAVYARAQDGVDGSARAVSGIRVDGTTERAVSVVTSVESNVYPNGAGFDKDGSAFNYTIDPTETIKELIFTVVGAEIDVEVTTTDGDTFTVPLDSAATFNRWQIDKVVLKDPNANTPRVAGGWAGE